MEASVYEVYGYYRFEHRHVLAAEIYEGLHMFQGQREAGVWKLLGSGCREWKGRSCSTEIYSKRRTDAPQNLGFSVSFTSV